MQRLLANLTSVQQAVGSGAMQIITVETRVMQIIMCGVSWDRMLVLG